MKTDHGIPSLSRRGLFGLLVGAVASPAFATTQKPNVLFVIIDDLNDFPSPFRGYRGIVTPNFDRIAKAGAVFFEAMAHVPECTPSRAAIFSGVAAWKSGVYSNASNMLDGLFPRNHSYLPGWFRKNGGQAAYSGKFYHGFGNHIPPGDYDTYYLPDGYRKSVGDLGAVRSRIAALRPNEDEFDFGPGVLGGEFDIAITDWAVKQIMDGYLTSRNSRFLGVGLRRPHLPHVVPASYFNLYPLKPSAPPGYWPYATTYRGNHSDRIDLPSRALNTGKMTIGDLLDVTGEHKAYLRSYLASVSFADAQLGRIFDAYKAKGLSESTYLIVTSDNGFLLGEKMLYQKSALWERALRVPLIIAGPGIKSGIQYKPVSLLDIYPTLCGLAKLPIPSWCDGRDLSPWLLGAAPLGDTGAVSVIKQGKHFYWRAMNRFASYTNYGDGTGEAYNHDRYSTEFDPYEFRNIVNKLDPVVKANLSALAPSSWVPQV